MSWEYTWNSAHSQTPEKCYDFHFNRFLWWTQSSWFCGRLHSRSHGYDLWHPASLLCGPASWWCARCSTSSKSSNPSITPPTVQLWVFMSVFVCVCELSETLPLADWQLGTHLGTNNKNPCHDLAHHNNQRMHRNQRIYGWDVISENVREGGT